MQLLGVAMNRWSSVAVCFGALLTLGGCADANPGDAGDPEGSAVATELDVPSRANDSGEDPGIGLSRESAAARANELGIDDPPDVAPIRAITPDAAGLRVKTQCMIDKGYPYEFDDPSGDTVSIDMKGIDEEQFNLDTYICELQYPVERRFQRDLDERGWRILYDHYVGTYIPCVESLGYVVDPFPSFEVYFSRIQAGEMPYSPALEVGPQVMQDVELGKYESVGEFHRSVCPDTVSIDLLYPP